MKTPGFLVIIILLISLSSCEALFSYSPLTVFQRDPSVLTSAQLDEYAIQAIDSGDVDVMKEVLDLLVTRTDKTPETELIIVDLAIGVTGLTIVFGDLISIDPSASLTEINTAIMAAIAKMDLSTAETAFDALTSAVAGGAEPSPTQYLFVAVSLAAKAADLGGSIDSLSTPSAAQQTLIDDALSLFSGASAAFPADSTAASLISSFQGMFGL